MTWDLPCWPTRTSLIRLTIYLFEYSASLPPLRGMHFRIYTQRKNIKRYVRAELINNTNYTERYRDFLYQQSTFQCSLVPISDEGEKAMSQHCARSFAMSRMRCSVNLSRSYFGSLSCMRSRSFRFSAMILATILFRFIRQRS